MGTTTFRKCDPGEIVRQIGRWNVAAISGGRVQQRKTGITLPVGCGYSVTVDLDANDTYVVRRVFCRSGRTWVKGELKGVYCEEVGEIAYRASSFRSYPFGNVECLKCRGTGNVTNGKPDNSPDFDSVECSACDGIGNLPAA